MTLELALLRAARPQLDPTRQALAERVERLEAALGAWGAEVGRLRVRCRAAARDAARSEPPPERGDPGSRRERPTGGGRLASPTVAAEEGLDLERITGLWPAVLDQMRDRAAGAALARVLGGAPGRGQPRGAGARGRLPAGAAFNKRKAEAAEARDRFADAVTTILGERLRPVYVLLEGDEAEAPAEPKLSRGGADRVDLRPSSTPRSSRKRRGSTRRRRGMTAAQAGPAAST